MNVAEFWSVIRRAFDCECVCLRPPVCRNCSFSRTRKAVRANLRRTAMAIVRLGGAR